MKTYSQTEALRRYWQVAIDKVQTAHGTLKTALLRLLEEEKDFETFTARRDTLLSENHGVDFWWVPRFTAIREFLHKWFDSVRPKGGSRLREQLKAEPVLPDANAAVADAAALENDADFERALYDNPAAARQWLETAADVLCEATSSAFFERLQALAPALSSQTLMHLLERAALHAPEATLGYALSRCQSCKDSREYGDLLAPLLVRQWCRHPDAAQNLLLVLAVGADIPADISAFDSVAAGAKNTARASLRQVLSHEKFAEKTCEIKRHDAEYISSYSQPAPYDNALTLVKDLAIHQRLHRSPLLMAFARALEKTPSVTDEHTLQVIQEQVLQPVKPSRPGRSRHAFCAPLESFEGASGFAALSASLRH